MKKERKRFPRQEGDEKKYRREHGVKNLKLPGPKHPKSIPKESRGGGEKERIPMKFRGNLTKKKKKKKKKKKEKPGALKLLGK